MFLARHMKSIWPMYRSANDSLIWRKVKRWSTAVGLWSLLLGVMVACQSVDPVVKVGLVAPFEGRHRELGYDVLYSARLAVREINAAGGINGTRVALVALDDSGNPEYARATANSLVIDPGIVAVVGHWLPETNATAAPIYDQNDLVLLPGGEEPFTATDPTSLSAQFVTAYEEVTPFDESPGPYALSAYEAFLRLFEVFADAQQSSGQISRQTVHSVLTQLE